MILSVIKDCIGIFLQKKKKKKRTVLVLIRIHIEDFVENFS